MTRNATRARRGACLFSGVTLDEARSRLRAAPLAEFVRVRGRLVRELREDGEPRLARILAGTKKPTRSDWALAQVEAPVKAELERAREEALRAQEHSGGDALRAALSRYHAAVTAVVDAAKTILRRNGMPVTTTQERAMRATLERHGSDPLEALPKTRPARQLERVAGEHDRARRKSRAEGRARREAERNRTRARAEVERKTAALEAARRRLEALEH